MADLVVPGYADLFYRWRLFERGFSRECASKRNWLCGMVGGATASAGYTAASLARDMGRNRNNHELLRRQQKAGSL